MRTKLAAWHTSLWAALGLAACGGRALTTDDTTDPDGGSGGTAGVGGTGAADGSGGSFVDFGGVSGVGGSFGFGGSDGVGGSVGVGGSFDVGGATGVGGVPDFGGAGGIVGTGGRSDVLTCTNARPRIGLDGVPTGYVECSSGWIRRPEIRECASAVPRPNMLFQASDAATGCTRDADCSNMLHGFCQPNRDFTGRITGGICASGCIRDEECNPGYVCLCGDPVGTCIEAGCRSDADCGGLACASSYVSGCGTVYSSKFACQQPTDGCSGNLDCTPTQNCSLAPSGRYCQTFGVCGRPFLVDGIPRLAPLVHDAGGWGEPVREVGALAPQTRARLAEHWSSNGLMEHASIAAFARFTLELLACGAPASLVEEAQCALRDEIAHTKLCFALATRYAGRPLGPGALPVTGALENGAFFDVVATAVTEACIGETLAAIEAAEAAEHAVDPDVRSALVKIAEDEGRHAELGWKFLRWALENANTETRARIVEHLHDQVERELMRIDGDCESIAWRNDARTLLEHGVLSNTLRAEVRAAGLAQLILPIARAISKPPEQLVA